MEESGKELSHLEFIITTSVHLILIEPNTSEPRAFGSGILITYKERLFLLSVAHVTDLKGLQTTIETYAPTKGIQSTLYGVDGMAYFTQHPVPSNITPLALEQMLNEPGERLDISFGEIKEPITLLQPEWDLGDVKIEAGHKHYIDLEKMMTDDLSRDREYDLCGRIRQRIGGNYILSEPKLVIGMKYQGTDRNRIFHRFLVPDIISNADEYRGCSGAPIFDDEGRLVALASKVRENSKLLYAFSIVECKRLLDKALEIGLL